MAELTYTLGEHPQIIELLSVLEKNNLQRQKEEVQALVGYIDGMEDKLAQMMEEMKEIRLEVGKLHDKGIRAKCAQLVTAAEGKIQQVKAMVSTAKANLISSAGRMVQTFQEKGAPPCVMRCRLCVFPPFSRAWNTASLMPARRWSNAPGSWMYSGRSCIRREST